MATPDLDELARAARDGGSREMNELLERLRPLVCRWAFVWTANLDLAEDVAQWVLLKIHRSFSGYSPSGKVTTWAYRITRNAVMDVERRAERERTRLASLTRDALASSLGPRRDALELLAAADELRRFMSVLSPQQRAVLDLVELQGFTASEVADMLEIAPATVRVHLHRAKAAIGDAGRPARRMG